MSGHALAVREKTSVLFDKLAGVFAVARQEAVAYQAIGQPVSRQGERLASFGEMETGRRAANALGKSRELGVHGKSEFAERNQACAQKKSLSKDRQPATNISNGAQKDQAVWLLFALVFPALPVGRQFEAMAIAFIL